jgi:hypothetical protein
LVKVRAAEVCRTGEIGEAYLGTWAGDSRRRGSTHVMERNGISDSQIKNADAKELRGRDAKLGGCMDRILLCIIAIYQLYLSSVAFLWLGWTRPLFLAYALWGVTSAVLLPSGVLFGRLVVVGRLAVVPWLGCTAWAPYGMGNFGQTSRPPLTWLVLHLLPLLYVTATAVAKWREDRLDGTLRPARSRSGTLVPPG